MDYIIDSIIVNIDYVAIGLLLEITVALFAGKKLKIPIVKTVIIVCYLTFAEIVGISTMYWIENGSWGGQSFYGALLFAPLLMFPATILKVNYRTICDLSAPCICMALAALKIRCLLGGCCCGIELFSIKGRPIFFPSQFLEMVSALAILVTLLWKIYTAKDGGKIFGYLLVIYGISRFILNTFRYNLQSFIWILPAGHFWSIISVIAGIIWLIVVNKLNEKNAKTEALKSE